MPEIWQILMDCGIDFKGKSLIDLGSGYGDMCLLAHQTKADLVWYVDKDGYKCEEFYHQRAIGKKIVIRNSDIEMLEFDDRWDYILCFSVLPYISQPHQFFEKISKIRSTLILECQYASDGPGFGDIEDDDDMKEWLSEYWNSCEPIGKTLVKDRQKYRTIWVCKND